MSTQAKVAAFIAGVMIGVMLVLGVAAVRADATPGDPHADTSECVSSREANSAKRLSRRETERRWEVKGLGQRADVLGREVWLYPWCGHPFDPSNVSDPGYAWIGASYGIKNRVLVLTLWYKNDDNIGAFRRTLVP